MFADQFETLTLQKDTPKSTMTDLTSRADDILNRKNTYTTPPSTCFRIFEMYEMIPSPVYTTPEQGGKAKDISRR